MDHKGGRFYLWTGVRDPAVFVGVCAAVVMGLWAIGFYVIMVGQMLTGGNYQWACLKGMLSSVLTLQILQLLATWRKK